MITYKLLLYVAFLAVSTFAITNVVNDVTFRLFTKNNPSVWKNLGFNAKNLTDSKFDFNKDAKVITHGFLNNGSGMSCIAIKDAYLEHYDVNIIIVDYERIASLTSLTLPQDKIRLVGEYTATFINFLIGQGYDRLKLHLMGHSLGAHVIGHAARHVIGGKIARVTGLDPGLMLPGPTQLDANVAHFVDIIHTCSGVYGMVSSIGHADFRPNGGVAIQPSCNLLGGITCSHYEAVWFYVRSIHRDQRYPSRLCNSYWDYNAKNCENNSVAYMGIKADPKARGDYYINTKNEKDN